jgi:integrase
VTTAVNIPNPKSILRKKEKFKETTEPTTTARVKPEGVEEHPEKSEVVSKTTKKDLIHDPEDSDFEIEVEGEADEVFPENANPKLSLKAQQSLKDSSEEKVLDSRVLELVFRKGHPQLPLVTLMKGADLQMLSLLKQQPRKDETWMGFAVSTSDEHINMLKLFASNVDPEEELVTALIEAINKLRVTREWRWSTTLKRAASLQGALAILPLYMKGSIPILLKHSPVWKAELLHFSKKAKEESPKQAKPATADQVNEVIVRFAKKNLGVAVAIMLGWMTAGRLGCILQLEVADVRINEKRFSVTFRRGKGVRLRGPYTVYSAPLPDQWMKVWKEYIKGRDVKLFPKNLTGTKLKESLREVDSNLEQRSIRRGALQTMSSQGASVQTLMRFSGHTVERTLERYLNWNQVNSKVESDMAATGNVLVPQQKPKKPAVRYTNIQSGKGQSKNTRPTISTRSAAAKSVSSARKAGTKRK